MEETFSSEIRNYIVLFLDVLGQTEGLKRVPPILTAKTKEERNRCTERYFKVLRPVYLLQERLEEGYREFFSKLGKDWPELIQKAIAPIRAPDVLQFQRFSDGIVAFFNLSRDVGKMGPFGAHVLLLAAASAQLTSLAEGYLIRGGLEVDDAIELKKGQIYGRALMGAYELEKSISDYPRIVVGAGFMRLLRSYAQGSADADPLLRVSAEAVKDCSKMIFEDYDGRFVVDFLGQELARGSTSEKRRELFGGMLKFVKNQMMMYYADGKKFPRLKRLHDYMISRRQFWVEEVTGDVVK